MDLADLIVSTTILDNGPIETKALLIERLLAHLARQGQIPAASVASVLDTVTRREALGTTGLGEGVAIPHARHPGMTRTLGILAICRPPVWFDSLDGEPVDIVVLYLAPMSRAAADTREITRLSHLLLRQLAEAPFRERLRQSRSAAELARVVAAIESCDSSSD